MWQARQEIPAHSLHHRRDPLQRGAALLRGPAAGVRASHEQREPGQVGLPDRALQEQVPFRLDGHVQEHHGQRDG